MPDYLPLPDGDAWEEDSEWCPACDCFHSEGVPCANESDLEDDMRWGPDDVVGLGPGPAEDAWYQDLVNRADHPGNDSLGGWRDA